MNICVICHYFVPEVGAPSARIYDMAKYWIKYGHKVSVITNFPNHPTGIIHKGYEGKSFMIENMDGIKVIRCKTLATPNKGFVKKTLGHLYFSLMAKVQGKKEIPDIDVIMVSSPTLFSVITAWKLSRELSKPYVFEVRDLWPGIFVDLGIIKNKFIIKALEQMEMFLYRKAKGIVTVTESFKTNIALRGINENKIYFIPNGVDTERFKPAPPDNNLIKELGLEGKLIVLYCGAHGISQGLQTVVDAANILKEEKDIHFLFVGDGADKQKIIDHAEELGLTNVTFVPSQPSNRVMDFYNSAGICLVPLRNIPLFNAFIPSKMFEIMACKRPIVASVAGESAKILSRSKAAIVVPPENSVEIAKAIGEIKNSPEKVDNMSEAGRSFVDENYNRDELARKYLKVFEETIK